MGDSRLSGGRSTYSADDILAIRVARMEHVEILLNYDTVEVLGEQQVTGLRVRSRLDQSERTLTVDGVFVEIGLLPNTAFVMDVLELNAYGDISLISRRARVCQVSLRLVM